MAQLQESPEIVLRLSPAVDSLVADDIVALDPPDAENLSEMSGDFLSARLLRKLGLLTT